MFRALAACALVAQPAIASAQMTPPGEGTTLILTPTPPASIEAGSRSPEAAAPHGTAESVRERILQLWFARKEALDASDTVAASARVEELRAFLQQERITADRILGRGFAYEGYENLREGNYERAREAFDLARTFDPYLPEAQTGYAVSLLRAGRGVTTFLDAYMSGLKLAWSQFSTDEVQVANAALLGTIALLCGLTVFSLVVIARCQGRARHDLFEAARRLLPERGARVLAWVVFLLPLLIWAGGIWVVFFWLALCFRYMRISEKAVAALVLILAGLSPLMVAAALDRFEATTNPEIRVILAALQDGHDTETLMALERIAADHPESADLRMLLGIAQARADRMDDAFASFQSILQTNPSHPGALVNFGNVYFRVGEFGEAATRYRKAAQTQPGLTSSWWNLYLAQTELLHFAEADESLNRARALDAPRVGALAARKQGQNASALLLDEAPTIARLKAAVENAQGPLLEDGHALANPVTIASGLALCFGLILSLGGSALAARSCARCGRPHCARCQPDPGAASSGACARCTHLFSPNGGLTQAAREEGLRRLERRLRITGLLRRLLSLGLPGSGLILAGRSALGLPVMMCWMIALAYLLGRDELLTAPRVPVLDIPSTGVIVMIVAMALAWIAGNTASLNRRHPGDGAIHGA